MNMKKSLLVMALAGLAMTSCKKMHTCECTEYEDGQVIGTSSWSAKMKKSDAETWCNGYSSTSTFMGTTYKEECELK
jgi:hypothetical protein